MAILKDLIVHGSSRFLNKIYASELETPLIEAEAGIIKKLKADDVTVVGLLDVKGQLHTNSWSNSNIATIDGSFYITPTIGSDSGTVAITATSLNFTGTNYAVTNLYLGDGSTITWPQYSKVLVTGQILSNGEWIPLGTLLGQLSAPAAATSIEISSIKDNKNSTSSVLAALVNNGTTSSDYRNLKVSLYQRAASSTDFRPLGIYMTATGTNGRTFLDIYGGVESLSNSNNYGGFAEPNVRIGNLWGLPNVGGQTPSGWGIYTDNGYFKGIIAADKGYIGSGSRYWVIANYEDDSNPNNSRSYIYSYNGTDNGTDSVTSTVEGIYLGTDGIRNYKDSTHYVTIKNGVISALGVDLTGQITATSGTIGGWNIGTDTNKSLYYGNQVPGATTTNLVLSPTSSTNSNAIGGSATGLNWFLSAGKVFGVTTAGALYATSGKIGGFDIGATYIKNGKTSYNETTYDGVYLGTDGIGLGKGKFYVTSAGALTATSGHIGGWEIGSNYLLTGTWGTGESALLSTGSSSYKEIGGSGSINKWVFTAGANFGVTKAGDLYASSANISGKITATSGTIGGIEIENGALKVSSINIGSLGGASNYAQKTDVNAINLSPYFSYSPYEANDYWKSWSNQPAITFTEVGDGWVRIQCTNTSTSTIRKDFYPIHNLEIKEGTDYTWLIEFRNNQSQIDGVASGSDFYLVQTNDCQFWGGTIKENLEGMGTGSTTRFIDNIPIVGTEVDGITITKDYVYKKRFIKTSEATGSSRWTDGSANNLRGLACFTARCAKNTTIDCEVRISVYEGRYLGEYKPYVDQKARLVANNANTTANEAKTAVQNVQTLIRQYSDGVLVCKTNNTVGALVNADGSFDITSLTWADGVPSAGTSLSSFSSSGIRLGANSSSNYIFVDSDSFDIYHGNTNLVHFGYGNGTTVSGSTGIAPYYTLGTRSIDSQIVGNYSLVSGYSNIASGYASHSEGYSTLASNACSHAEGYDTEASGHSSHSQGRWTVASNICAHAEGNETTASGYCAHAEGIGTLASSMFQHVMGKYNVQDSNYTYALIIGNGTAVDSRSNAFTVDWSGNINSSGIITQNGIAVSLDGHTHAADDITSGTLPIERGGSGNTGTSATTTISSIVTAGSGFTVDSASYAQWGKVAMIHIVFKKNATAITTATNISLGTLVSGKRPKYRAMGMSGWTQNALVYTDGVIHMYGTVAANETIGIYSTFILA